MIEPHYKSLWTHVNFNFNQLLMYIEKFSPLPGFEPGTKPICYQLSYPGLDISYEIKNWNNDSQFTWRAKEVAFVWLGLLGFKIKFRTFWSPKFSFFMFVVSCDFCTYIFFCLAFCIFFHRCQQYLKQLLSTPIHPLNHPRRTVHFSDPPDK